MMPAFLLTGCLAFMGADGAISSEDLDRHFSEIRRARNLCGPRAAWYCLRRTGRAVEWEEVLGRCHMGDDGMSLEEIQGLFASFGVPARGMVGEASHLGSLPLPCLVVLDSRHCVVLEGIDKTKGEAKLFEPARGEVLTVPLGALEAQCSGEAILLDESGLPPAAFFGCIGLGIVAVLALWWATPFLLGRRGREARTLATAVAPPAPTPQ
jgi:hypothetical protein